MKYLRNFNQKLRDIRLQKKLSRTELAVMCGVSEETIRAWESMEEGGREYPEVDQLIDFCVKASVALEVLLDVDAGGSVERQLVLPGLDNEEHDDPVTRMLGALADLDDELESTLPTQQERELLLRFRQCDDEKRTFIMQMLPKKSALEPASVAPQIKVNRASSNKRKPQRR